MMSFKSTLELTNVEKVEINEDNLNERLIGLKCVAEYYIDKTRDAEKMRLVKFNMISP